MQETGLGRLERVDARQIWRNEASEFTPWLRQNIALLAEALGIEIDVDVQNEVTVGVFWADLVGTDIGSGAKVLIENQLEKSDHSHLGQLLTYAGGLDAAIIVWLAPSIQEEHRQAFQWLNEHTHEDVLFFGVEIELLRIDGSKPAPHFKVVVEPNEWQKAKSAQARRPASPVSSERNDRYRAFFHRVILELKAREPSSTTASPEHAPGQNWWGFSLGRTGFVENFVFGYDNETRTYVVRIELYIDVTDKQQNEAIFDRLLHDREAIERDFGEPLLWTRRDDVRLCRVYVQRPGSIDDDEAALADHLEWGIERMQRMRQAFRSRVLDLRLPLATTSGMSVDIGDQPPI